MIRWQRGGRAAFRKRSPRSIAIECELLKRLARFDCATRSELIDAALACRPDDFASRDCATREVDRRLAQLAHDGFVEKRRLGLWRATAKGKARAANSK